MRLLGTSPSRISPLPHPSPLPSVFLSYCPPGRLLVSAAGPAAADRSKVISPWFVLDGSSMVPAIAPFSCWPRGLVRECSPAGRPQTSTSMPNTSFNWWSSHMASFSSSPCGWRTRIRPTLVDHLHCIGLSQATPSIREQWPLVLHTLWPLIRPVFADGGRIKGHCSRFSRSLFFLSSSTSEAGGQLSSPQRVPRCGLLCSSAFSWYSFPSISPPVSPLRYGMVGTVAGDGAPRSLSDFRSSRVCWTRPFSFSDSSLVGLRPFLLPLFHPARALCAVFVALSCLLRYWLGFYLNWQLMTTVSLSLTFRQLYFAHNNICSKPLFTKINRLSTLVANCQLFTVLKEFAASSNLWNKHRLPLSTVDMRALGVAN